MPLIVKHLFVSAKADGPDATVVRPSNWNADHVITGAGILLAGTIIDYVGFSWPVTFLECFGQSVASATYPILFNALVAQGTVTFTLGTPGVVNWTAHGQSIHQKVRFSTTGVLPTGIVAGTDYYIIPIGYTANSFRIAAAPNGAAIAFTVTQSGTHTGVVSAFGASADLTTFTIPDFRGRVAVGMDYMGGVAASRILSVNAMVLGVTGGEETHVLTTAEVAAHLHAVDPPSAASSAAGAAAAHTHSVDPPITTSSLSGALADHVHSIDPPVTTSTAAGAAAAHTHSIDPPATVSTAAGATVDHTHSIDPPATVSTAAGATVDHTHSINPPSTATDTEAAHTHTDTFAVTGTISGGSHTHGLTAFEEWNAAQGGGSHSVLQPGWETGGTGEGTPTDATTPSLTFVGVISGAVTAGGSHSHLVDIAAFTSAAGGAVAAHTHTTNIAAFTSAADGAVAAHTHTTDILAFTSASGGALVDHTHDTNILAFNSALAGAAASHSHTLDIAAFTSAAGGALVDHTHSFDIASFNSGSTGGGGAHNNLQPMVTVRKLIFVG